MSLQYLKKELIYEVDVFHADKHESLLHVDSIILSTPRNLVGGGGGGGGLSDFGKLSNRGGCWKN